MYTEKQVEEILVVFMWYLLANRSEVFKQLKGDKFIDKAKTVILAYNSFEAPKERIDYLIDNNKQL